MGAKSKANQAHLTNLSKQNLVSWKATVKDASDSDDLDWIPMPELPKGSLREHSMISRPKLRN